MTDIDKRYAEQRLKLETLGQGHLLRYWQSLQLAQKEKLLQQLDELQESVLLQIPRLFERTGKASSDEILDFKPLPVISLPTTDQDLKNFAQARAKGEQALSDGHVGSILVAGGLGTRLGLDSPKGMFPIGPVSLRTLFQYHLEKTVALERRYRAALPLYIMTSDYNDQQTREYLQKCKYFGKDPQTVIIFKQGRLPSFDASGRIFLEDEFTISMSPDGHGGLFSALEKYNLVQDMQARGIKYLYYFQVDNVLSNICDPAFIGFHMGTQAEMSAKTVAKRDPFEKLGNIGLLYGKRTVIEYSELDDEKKILRDEHGRLIFEQGSIAIHLFNVSFISRLIEQNLDLPIHLAHKAIRHLNRSGRVIKPRKPNGYKMEQFIFDSFSFADKVTILEADRSSEFSPVKNKSGVDSPETARQALSDLFGAWLEGSGVPVPRRKNGRVLPFIEISPLYALDAAELAQKLLKGVGVKKSLLLE